MSRISQWGREALPEAIIAIPAIVLLASPVVFWFLTFIGDPLEEIHYASGSPFTLAQVMAIFGAFGLAGGFSSYGDDALRLNLRRVGVVYLFSALGFAIFGMIFPIFAPMAKSSNGY